METLSFQFADTIVTATMQFKRYAPDANHPNHVNIVQDGWFVVAADAFSGQSATAKLTDEQIHALVSLSFGAGESGYIPTELRDKYYEILNPVLADWPAEVRPIP